MTAFCLIMTCDHSKQSSDTFESRFDIPSKHRAKKMHKKMNTNCYANLLQ